MRGLVKCLAKESEEMVTGETSFFGDLVEIQWMVVAVVDKFSRSSESLERVMVGHSGCLAGLHNHFESIPVRQGAYISSGSGKSMIRL